ncbi:MAG: Mbov_0395 family pilin-like conjugal transfer protein [Agathobacter sp.]
MNMLGKIVLAKDKLVHNVNKLYLGVTTFLATLAGPAFCAMAEDKTALNTKDAENAIVGLINSLLNPILAIVGALGTLYCVLLGVKYAKAEEPQDREKAKQHLKSAIIGFVLIFVLIVALKLLMPQFQTWMTNNQTPTTPAPTTPQS